MVRHIAADTPVAARRVRRELLPAGDSLVIFPRCGRPGRLAGTRERMAISPHFIVHRVAREDVVTILRVWHAALDRRASRLTRRGRQEQPRWGDMSAIAKT